MSNTANGHAAAPSDAELSEHIARGEALFSANGPMDIEAFRTQAKATVDAMCDYFAGVEQYPVASQVKPGYLAPLLPKDAPEEPEAFEDIMKDFQQHIMPGVTHWQVSNSPYRIRKIITNTIGFVPDHRLTFGQLSKFLLALIRGSYFAGGSLPTSTRFIRLPLPIRVSLVTCCPE